MKVWLLGHSNHRIHSYGKFATVMMINNTLDLEIIDVIHNQICMSPVYLISFGADGDSGCGV